MKVRKLGEPASRQLAAVIGYKQFKYTNEQIAELLGLTMTTVQNYVRIAKDAEATYNVLDRNWSVNDALKQIGPVARRRRYAPAE